MIDEENITKKQAKHLLKLIQRWTRSDIMARLGRISNLECVDYAMRSIEYENKIREFVFGTSNLADLSVKFGMRKKAKGK